MLLSDHTVFVQPGLESDLSGNFLVYGNANELRERLRELIGAYDPAVVRQRLLDTQGSYVDGNLGGLQAALDYAKSLCPGR